MKIFYFLGRVLILLYGFDQLDYMADLSFNKDIFLIKTTINNLMTKNIGQ
jgi:hypothetical protein